MSRLLTDSVSFMEHLNAGIRFYTKACETFVEKFPEDPARAFSWSQSTFEHAAYLAVFKEIKDATTGGKVTFASLFAHAKQKLLNKAIYPQFSTNPCSNLMHQYTTSAWAKVVEDCEDEAKWFEDLED